MKPYRGHYPDCWGFYELYGKECGEFSRASGTCRSCKEHFLGQLRKTGQRTDPEYFIKRAARDLGLNKKKTRWAVSRVRMIRKKKPIALCRSPLTVAAGILYITCLAYNNSRTQKEVAKTCRTTEGTVRVVYKDLLIVLKEQGISSTVKQ